MIGSVTLSVCVSVCLPLFLDMEQPKKMVFKFVVGYGSQMKPIDFGVNRCIFKVTGDKNMYFALSPVLEAYDQI